MASIGENIRRIRMGKGMTQDQLAKACSDGMIDGKKMFGSAIRKYESGKVVPKLDMVQRIASGLGVSIGDITEWNQMDENGQEYQDYWLTVIDRAKDISMEYGINEQDARNIVDGDFKLAEEVFYKKVTLCPEQPKTPGQSESAQTGPGKED